jgi:hypothetical protein
MTDNSLGSAWYELGLRDEKLRTSINGVVGELKKAGEQGERAFATPMERATGRVASGVDDIISRFNSLKGKGPEELGRALDRATTEADEAFAAVRKLATAGEFDQDSAQARKYADALTEIGIEAKQDRADLLELGRADPKFNTPQLQKAADELDRVGREADQAAAELNAMKGVHADTHLEKLSQEAREAATNLDRAGKQTDGLGTKLRGIQGMLVGLGLAIGVQQVVSFFTNAARAAADEEQAIKTLTVAIRENDAAWDGNIDAVEGVIAARQALGFSDDEQRASLQSLVSVTKDTSEALDLQRTAMDLARLKGMALGAATELLGKVYAGNLGILARYGIQLERGTSATEAIAEIQRRAAGQAEAWASENAGAAEVAAIAWDNAQEDIGRSLQPLMTKLLQFGADVLPAVTDGLADLGAGASDVVDDIGPLLGLVGELGALFLEHADQIIPLLVAAIAVKYVASLEAGALKTKALTLAVNGLKGAILLGLPYILEGADALGKWRVEMGEGGPAAAARLEDKLAALNLTTGFLQDGTLAAAYAQDRLREASEASGRTIGDVEDILLRFHAATDATYDDLKAAAEELGVDWDSLAIRATNAAERSGTSWEDFLQLMADGVEQSGAMDALAGLPEGVARLLKDTGDAAEDSGIEDALASGFETGSARAVAAVDGMFADIAAVIAARENELRAAGGDARAAWFDPLTWQQQLGAVNAQIESADAELAEDLRANAAAIQQAREDGDADALAQAQRATGEITREHAARSLALQQQQIELQTNLALTGTEMEQAAKLSALATSDFMAEGLASKDPEVRAVFANWKQELEDQIGAMEADADEGGGAISGKVASGISDRTPEVVTATGELRRQAIAELNKGDAGAGGRSLIGTWINGMRVEWDETGYAALTNIANAAGRILGMSLPTEGPLKGGVFSGGFSVFESWGQGADAAGRQALRLVEARLTDVGALLTQGALMAQAATPAPAFSPAIAASAFGGLPMAPAAPIGGGPDSTRPNQELHVHLETVGQPVGIEDELALGRAVRRVLPDNEWSFFGG